MKGGRWSTRGGMINRDVIIRECNQKHCIKYREWMKDMVKVHNPCMSFFCILISQNL
jgi:hypothetical protein